MTDAASNPVTSTSSAGFEALDPGDAADMLASLDSEDGEEAGGEDGGEAPATRDDLQLAEPDDEEGSEGELVEAEDAGEWSDVEFEGATYKVPAALKDAFLRQSDYTRKTQEVAQARHEALEIARAAAEERALYANHLSQVVATLEAQADPFRQINWQYLAETNPGEWARLREAQADHESRLAQAREAQGMVQQQAEAEQQRALQMRANEERRILLEKLPQWRDAKTMRNEQAAIAELLSAIGYTPQEIGSVVDHKAVVMSRLALDGLRYRELMSKSKTSKPRAEPPRTIRGGSQQQQGKTQPVQVRKAFNRLAQTGKAEDAVRFLLSTGS